MVENSSIGSSGILAPIFPPINPAQGFHLPDQLLVQNDAGAATARPSWGLEEREGPQAPAVIKVPHHTFVPLISENTARSGVGGVADSHQVFPRKEVGNGRLVLLGE